LRTTASSPERAQRIAATGSAEIGVLRSQLFHADKLTTLGVLAAGVAHDLNNALVPVLGLTKLVAARMDPASRDAENLALVFDGGKRAQQLVRQILAFTRKKAPTKIAVRLNETACPPGLRSPLPPSRLY
jgi:signal transduction histidine kinase